MRNRIILILICLLALPTLAGAETKWQKMQTLRAESYGKMMIGNLSYAQDRSLKLYETVVLEAEQKSRDKDPLVISKLLSAKTLLERNQADLSKLKLILEPQNVTKANWIKTKSLVKTIIKDLRLTHGEIKEVLKLLD